MCCSKGILILEGSLVKSDCMVYRILFLGEYKVTSTMLGQNQIQICQQNGHCIFSVLFQQVAIVATLNWGGCMKEVKVNVNTISQFPLYTEFAIRKLNSGKINLAYVYRRLLCIQTKT